MMPTICFSGKCIKHIAITMEHGIQFLTVNHLKSAEIDSDLIGCYLAAINTFGKEIFRESCQEIVFNRYRIYIRNAVAKNRKKQEVRYVISLICEGQLLCGHEILEAIKQIENSVKKFQIMKDYEPEKGYIQQESTFFDPFVSHLEKLMSM